MSGGRDWWSGCVPNRIHAGWGVADKAEGAGEEGRNKQVGREEFVEAGEG